MEIYSKSFKPKAHILRLLGEELIKNPIMAIYELVKNSYDADAVWSKVEFINILDETNAKIVVEDNGIGLTETIIETVWLEPGSDHRKPIDHEGKREIIRTPIYKRVPMGEKGVGRFAVHKLGDTIELRTRPALVDPMTCEKKLLDYEIILKVDWKVFQQSQYLEDIPIQWQVIKNEELFYFKEQSGTRIEISNLKEPWSRRMARELKRDITSMLSPKNDERKFKIEIDFKNNWLDKLPEAKEFLDIAPYKFNAFIDEDYNLTIDYECSFQLNKGFGSRKLFNVRKNVRKSIMEVFRDELIKEELIEFDKLDHHMKFLNEKLPFGSIMLESYVYDLDSKSKSNYTYEVKTLNKVIGIHSGIKVFKDDIRVFNYGEEGNDWLELDKKRVNTRSWFSNNQIIGFVYLDSEKAKCLIEKTNREGFIENKYYRLFYKCCIEILNEFKTERWKDRQKWLEYIGETSRIVAADNVEVFKNLIDSTDFSDEEKKEALKKETDKLYLDFEERKETLLVPAGVGMTASIALHELEKTIPQMKTIINEQPFNEVLGNEKVDEMEDYLNGILSVLRKGGASSINFHDAIAKAISNYKRKFSDRDVLLKEDFNIDIVNINCDRRYLITIIMNLLDNSLYWLSTINKKDKKVLIKTTRDLDDNPCIFVVDNGPGFKDDIEDIVRPFFTRKKDGIGIGLYLIDTLMMKYGKLEIMDNESLQDYDIPSDYKNGAAIKLTFNKNQ